MNEKRPVSLKDEAVQLLLVEARQLTDKKSVEAWPACQRVLRLAPECPDAYYVGALALFHGSRYDEAYELLKRAPQECKEWPLTEWTKACIEVALGRLGDAAASARRAMHKDPSLKAQMAKDPDLEPIWDALRGPTDGAKQNTREKINRALAALRMKEELKAPTPMISAQCYSPAASPREGPIYPGGRSAGRGRGAEPAKAEGLLTYLCVRCSRRTNYQVGFPAPAPKRGLLSGWLGKQTPPPPDNPWMKSADAEMILQTVYPNRRAMEGLGPTVALDEADFCPFCRPGAQNQHVRVTFTCPTCKRQTVYHLHTNKESPQMTVGMDVRMSKAEFARWFLELAKAKVRLPELGADFRVETIGLCGNCGEEHSAKWALIWKLGTGENKAIPVGSIGFELLKKFVTSLDLPINEQPDWKSWEIDTIEKVFGK